jgi:hypothetical protein
VKKTAQFTSAQIAAVLAEHVARLPAYRGRQIAAVHLGYDTEAPENARVSASVVMFDTAGAARAYNAGDADAEDPPVPVAAANPLPASAMTTDAP